MALSGEPFQPAGAALWLSTPTQPVYGVLHTPPEGLADSGIAALLIPPFGWDNDCSYRRCRDWATTLAESGITAARIDLPGTESSVGSPLAPNRVECWIEAIAEASRWLRELTACDRLAAIGIGLGGMLGYAAATRAPIDDLVLWAVRASGRAYVRELRAYAAVTASETGCAAEAGGTDGPLGIGGHPMSAETASALAAIDLGAIELPDAQRRHALLIGRDAHGIDPRLRDHLGASGVELTLLESGEYRQMMSPPEIPFTPTATIAASVDWLRSLTARAPLPPASSEAGAPSKRRRPFGSRDSRTRRTVEFEHEGVRVRESVTQLRSDAGRLVGVITEPAGARSGSHCMVVVNSGALRNTGPNRMFVEIARGAAARGVPTARFDLPGLGDSDGVPIKSFERTADDDDESLAWLAQIYDHVQQLGVADRLVAGGFSLGGYLAIRAVLNDPRLIGAISVNPTGLTWTDKQRKRVIRDLIALAGPEAVTPRRAPGAPRGARHRVRERLARARRSVEAQVRRRLAEYDVLWCLEHRAELAGVRHTLDQLDATGRRAVLMLSENEQLLRMLDRPRIAAELARRPSIAVERLPNDDHLLRPLWVQELIIDRFCSALVQLGSAAPSEGPSRANATRRSFGEV